MTKRNSIIDSLRGLAILAMIMIHTNAYFLERGGWVSFVWNELQFAVPVFIFCSNYIYWQRFLARGRKSIGSYFKNRLFRLVIPYYSFLLVYLPIVYLKEPHKLTADYLLKSLAAIGGVDIGWLVLLFLCLTLMQPAIAFLIRTKKWVWLSAYTALSLIVTLIFLFLKPSFDYRWTMWLPWSFYIIYTYYFVRNEGQKWWLPVSIAAGLLSFVICYWLLVIWKAPLSFYQNKYPPNLYMIGYGLLSIPLLYLFFQRFNSFLYATKPALAFFSRYSYEVFFIHYIVIYVLTVYFKTVRFTPGGFFISVLSTTTIVQIGLNKIRAKIIFFQHYKAARQSGCLREPAG